MKQTVIEWFNQQLVDRQNGNGDSRSREEILEQAKEMEKQQTIEFAELCLSELLNGSEPKEEPKQDLPNKLESVLAKITNQNDLGLSQWYEVVYYSDGKWCSYSGSKTFEDGERVVEWKYCKDLI